MPKRISRETRSRVKIVTRSSFIPDDRSLSTCLFLILGHQCPVVTYRPLSFHIISTGPGGTDTLVYWLGRKGLSRTRTLLPLGMRILPYVLMISYCFFILDVIYTCAPAEFFVALNQFVILGYFFFSFSLAGVGIQFVLLQQPGADLAEIDTLKLVLIVRTVQYCNVLLISQGHQWC
jgi:hypothetical protein